MKSLEETINEYRVKAASSMIMHEQAKAVNNQKYQDFFFDLAKEQMQIADWLTDYKLLSGEQNAKNEDICVSCGEIIPEGRMVCPNCEMRYRV